MRDFAEDFHWGHTHPQISHTACGHTSEVTIPPSIPTGESHANYVSPCVLVSSLPKLAQVCMFIKHFEIMPATKKALSKFDLLLAKLEVRHKQLEQSIS